MIFFQRVQGLRHKFKHIIPKAQRLSTFISVLNCQEIADSSVKD